MSGSLLDQIMLANPGDRPGKEAWIILAAGEAGDGDRALTVVFDPTFLIGFEQMARALALEEADAEAGRVDFGLSDRNVSAFIRRTKDLRRVVEPVTVERYAGEPSGRSVFYFTSPAAKKRFTARLMRIGGKPEGAGVFISPQLARRISRTMK